MIPLQYKGDVVTLKRYVDDFRTHKEVKNKGELPQQYFRGHHEAIITEKQFDRCGRIMAMKS